MLLMMYYQQTIDNFITAPARADISSGIIEELRGLFFGHFDNYWFITLLEQNAFDPSRLRNIHNMLDIQSVYSTDAVIFSEGIEALDEMILTCKRYILPAVRDKLKVSGFFRSSNESKDDLIMRDMFSYTLPYNLQRLEELAEELKKALQ